MARSARSRTWSSVTRHRRSRLAGQHRRPAETGDHPATVGPASSAGDASSTGVAGADELVRRTLSWFAVAALAYRVAITPILVAGALGNLGTDIPRSLLAGLAVVLTGDLVLLVGVSMGRFRGLLRSPYAPARTPACPPSAYGRSEPPRCSRRPNCAGSCVRTAHARAGSPAACTRSPRSSCTAACTPS